MSYTRVNWEDSPTTTTPLSANNLNKMDAQIAENAAAIADLQATQGQIDVDNAFDTNSENPVQNKVVATAISELTAATSSFESNLQTETDTREDFQNATETELEDARTSADYIQYPSLGEAIRGQIDAVNENVKLKVDGGYVDSDGYLILTADGEPVGDPIGPFAGGGGGGGGGSGTSVMTITNTTGWVSKSIAENAPCSVSVTWLSTLDDLSTGEGTMTVTVNGAKKLVKTVSQGAVTVDVTNYLAVGSNKIKLSITDAYSYTRYINYTVTVIALSLTSTFDNSVPYSGEIRFYYTPVGLAEKTVHFELDGTALPDVTVTASTRQTLVIPAQSHGKHTIKCWFEATVEGATIESNTLFYEFASIVSGNNAPVIWSDWTGSSVAQFSTVVIDYYVYSNTLTTPITITLMDGSTQPLTVDRTRHVLSTKATTVGTFSISIATTGAATYTIPITVTQSEIDINPVTDDLTLYLSSAGRSNNEANPGTWSYNGISATFSGFNWASDGWQNDGDGNIVCRVAGDGRLTIPCQVFGSDFKREGKTISIDFKTSEVRNYDTPIISCLNGGVGFSITPQAIVMSSLLSSLNAQFKEDEHVRVDIVVEKTSENRLIYMYINGIMSRVHLYPTNDNFAQDTPVGISIGSDDATTDIYCIRVYENDLTRQQILKNWIADTQNIDEMLDRYNRNNIFDEYSQIVIANLPQDLPYLILEGSELPTFKGDKKTINGSFTDPSGTFTNFTFTNAQIDVQGTSSQDYARKNYKIKFKNGFVINGETVSTYAMRSDSIPVDTFTMKADVASSEGANNVELVRLYDAVCPYKTPAQQVANSHVRQGIDGFPIVIFWDNGEATTFLGKR